MEPAKIDWATINSVFAVDDLYEHINAPKWVDFSAPDQSIDDEAWFCRPDCNHPKRVEDFLKGTPPSKVRILEILDTLFSYVLFDFQENKSAIGTEILPLGDRNRRDGYLKRRGLLQPPLSSTKESKCERFVEDRENHNPNFSTTPSHQYNTMKAAIKSSTEKEKEKKKNDNSSQKEERPQLRSTLSARNLFAGRDILSQISEFCNELKRLTTRARERENVEGLSAKEECGGENVGKVDEREEGERERKPLLDMKREKSEAMEKSNGKEKQRRKKRAEETENTPISLDLKSVKCKEGDGLSQIRTCPPSPQCFSAVRAPKAAPLKASRLAPPPERGILQELSQRNRELRKEETSDNNNPGRTASTVVEKEARTLDVFWFLKPCTLSS
ncbi:Myosin-1 like [Actinidia chinensis var. chinensis]|uniref:Myosin-1 like n=1 Tax=Actinidia chinensis var. chinensis TaxID=1590841 RepID=A0A2R6RD15_ACTCC|nr:Myosin-1 like [Actinidia chinensis var. chinensis]